MYGIDLNKEIKYLTSSFRFFAEKEHHVTRLCRYDVLLLVYEGVLRFCEDGISYAVHSGEYHIQKQNSYQIGNLPSDTPKYLYIHFLADWTESAVVLPKSGTFDYTALKSDIEEMNQLSYSNAPYICKAELFYRILSKLYQTDAKDSFARKIADFIQVHYQEKITLDILCSKFSFCKNHIIHLLQKEYGKTPIAYLNFIRISNAERLLITTSDSLDSICYACGYLNYSHFYRQFLRKNQISPERFRQQHLLGE